MRFNVFVLHYETWAEPMLLRLHVLANKHQLSSRETNLVHAQLWTAVLPEIVPCINITRLRLGYFADISGILFPRFFLIIN